MDGRCHMTQPLCFTELFSADQNTSETGGHLGSPFRSRLHGQAASLPESRCPGRVQASWSPHSRGAERAPALLPAWWARVMEPRTPQQTHPCVTRALLVTHQMLSSKQLS